MIFLYLLLAHFLADFVLQPEKLVRWKQRKWSGIAVHGSVHLVISFILLAVYMPNMSVLAAILLIAAAHFLIDWLKIIYERGAKKYIGPFLVDQAAHISVLALASYALGNIPLGVQWGPIVWLYTDFSVVLGLCLLLGVTYVYELTLFQLNRTNTSKYTPNFKAMARRTVIAAVFYGIFLLFGAYEIVAFGV
ncbi:MAG: DUF3307 domain-containing protein [Candidatus Gracilibacteria bacterium]|nr:DUF3307 domain-containing protein [Candidatus Peregrinibacteria bacterium]